VQTTLYFYGGAGLVTGSNFLLESGDTRLMVDCGLFQGREAFETENWKPFPYDSASISHLIITHAHIDHIGRIPKLVREGFKGTIISTTATKALAEPLLLDSLELLTSHAQRHHHDILYDRNDIAKAMHLWRGVAYHEPSVLPDGFGVEFFDAGHILGSAMVRISRKERSIVFSGDLGGGNSPLLKEIEAPPSALAVNEYNLQWC